MDENPQTLNDGTESSTVQQGDPATPPVAKTDVAPPEEQSLSDVVRKAHDEATGASDSSAGQKLTQTEKPGSEPGLDEEDAKLPFHQHPRFQKLVTERREFEKRAKEHETLAKEREDGASRWQHHVKFMQDYGISNEDIKAAMNYLAMEKTDPAKARELFLPRWERLSELAGTDMPADLKAKVAEGAYSEGAAKEIWQLRKEKAQRDHSSNFQRMNATQQAETLTQERVKAAGHWDTSKRGSDPDFKPKARAEDADGKWELVADRFMRLEGLKPSQWPQDTVKNLEQAYADIDKLFQTRLAGKSTRPPLNTQRSSTSPKKRPEDAATIREVVSAAAKEHGIDWSPSEE